MRAVAALSHCVWLGNRSYEGLRGAEALCTHIMNLGDGWSMGRHCDSVAARGALLLLLLQKKKKRKEGER